MLFAEKPPKSVRGSLISVRIDYFVYAGLDWKEVLAAFPDYAKEDMKNLVKGNYTIEEFFATPAHFKRVISGVGWYPASLYNGITMATMQLMKKKKNIPFEETCRQTGRYAAEQHLTGFTSYVLRVTSIAQVINLVVRGWSGYYSEGEIKITKNNPGDAEMEADISYVIPELRFAMAGYFEVALEHKNAKNIQITSSVLTNKNNAFHFHLKWNE
jgi:hypothetical protein